jgi:hypothetical protein
VRGGTLSMDCNLDVVRGLALLFIQEQRDHTNGSPLQIKCSHRYLINLVASFFSIRLTAHIFKRHKLYSLKGKVVPVLN